MSYLYQLYVKKIASLVQENSANQDEVLDYRQSERWYKQLLCNKQLVKLPLSDHGLTEVSDSQSTVSAIIDWMENSKMHS